MYLHGTPFIDLKVNVHYLGPYPQHFHDAHGDVRDRGHGDFRYCGHDDDDGDGDLQRKGHCRRGEI